MHTPLRVLIGSLAPGMLPSTSAPPPTGTILLDLGADHPSHAGLLELRLWTEDGVVTSAHVVVGAMHRGVEKLFEVRDYRQIIMLADRHDWQAPFSGELSVALTCEQLLGLEIPPRAVWLRTLLAEHARILSHTAFLGYLPHRLGLANGLPVVREALRDQTLRLTGNRIHPMANRIGGLAVDATPDWLSAEASAMDAVRAAAEQARAWLQRPELAAETAGVAVLERGTIEQYGVTGPAARASGVDLDLRRQRSYLAYAELADLIPTPAHATGDAWARLHLLAEELATSAALVDACIAELRRTPGPVSVRLGKIVKLPEGEAYLAVEAPLGVAGVFLVSRGEKTPWRLKLRTPSFNHVAALEAVLPGVRVDRLEVTLASIGYVVGDLDK
ncbi:MAG TPA: NADH-quinone oxidoreductase subunit D [Propionibacteriaceae bacterium]